MNSIENFLDSLHHAHLDNARQLYVAKTIGSGQSERDISPVTNFVFEFFLYNSLYAVDWETSYAEGSLVYHDRQSPITERNMQNALERFCRQKCGESPEFLIEAFLPLAGLNDLAGEWTLITTDNPRKAEDGAKFFAKIAEIGQLAANNELGTTGKTFDLIGDCRYFAYGVRNNIFHGSKSLGEIYEPDQARRIGVYDLFLRCLNSLFFMATGRKEHGDGYIQLPIVQRCETSNIELSLHRVHRLLTKNMLKPGDSTLHRKLFRSIEDVPKLPPNERRALFYPSAGRDFFFPLLVGMPYCTDFFFYDMRSPDDQRPTGDEGRRLRNRHSRLQKGQEQLRDSIKELVPGSTCQEKDFADGFCLEFEFDSVARRAWIVHQDNMTFLTNDVPLAFYFHRGDSIGEGGSDQRWDSDLLPKLLAKSDPGIGCYIFTDGNPGVLLESVAAKCQKVSAYFYGLIRPSDAILALTK